VTACASTGPAGFCERPRRAEDARRCSWLESRSTFGGLARRALRHHRLGRCARPTEVSFQEASTVTDGPPVAPARGGGPACAGVLSVARREPAVDDGWLVHCEPSVDVLAVEFEHRRQGVGRALIRRYAEIAKAAGTDRVWVDAPDGPDEERLVRYYSAVGCRLSAVGCRLSAVGWREGTGWLDGDRVEPREQLLATFESILAAVGAD
jgi:GNAT superfamily N-acetyltransferase